MTPSSYQAEREKRGSKVNVARLLGVSRSTIIRRERGKQPINQEAWLALLALPVKGADEANH